MLIATTCPQCKALFRLADDMAGKTVKCQKCQQMFVVPTSNGTTIVPGTHVPQENQANVPDEAPILASIAEEATPAPSPTAIALPQAVSSIPMSQDRATSEERSQPAP